MCANTVGYMIRVVGTVRAVRVLYMPMAVGGDEADELMHDVMSERQWSMRTIAWAGTRSVLCPWYVECVMCDVERTIHLGVGCLLCEALCCVCIRVCAYDTCMRQRRLRRRNAVACYGIDERA